MPEEAGKQNHKDSTEIFTAIPRLHQVGYLRQVVVGILGSGTSGYLRQDKGHFIMIVEVFCLQETGKTLPLILR
ncbi:MAG: hypothetical protein EA391_07450 [Balneolaceae bacterium]|nr:MAG: hypothetical protein EA391_07450 [Balneolaceae bacterium]